MKRGEPEQMPRSSSDGGLGGLGLVRSILNVEGCRLKLSASVSLQRGTRVETQIKPREADIRLPSSGAADEHALCDAGCPSLPELPGGAIPSPRRSPFRTDVGGPRRQKHLSAPRIPRNWQVPGPEVSMCVYIGCTIDRAACPHIDATCPPQGEDSER